MGKDGPPGEFGARKMGGRSQSMSEKSSPQGPSIAGDGRAALKVEYSMVNYDFSMHESMSGDFSSSEEGNSSDNYCSEEEVGEATQRRVVMMHDENGNAVPVRMSEFYYDSVQPSVVKPEQQNSLSLNSNSSPRGTNNAPARRVIPTRPRGVQLSSSSEEENASSGRRCGIKQDLLKDEDDDSFDINKRSGRKFIEDDSQYDMIEDEEKKKEPEGKYENQFMRIAVPASEVKDVANVKKDVDHDKPKAGIRSNLVAGLQRAVSGVRLGEGERKRQEAKAKVNRVVGGIQRTSSQRGGVHRKSALEPRNFQRQHENVVGNEGKRQSISNIGRMVSLNRTKGRPANTNQEAAQLSSAVGSHGSASQSSVSHESLVQLRKKEFDDVDPLSSQRSMVSASSDRPRSSGAISGTSARSGRSSLAQVGRMLSRNRRKPATQTQADGLGNIERVDDRRRSTRASLSRIGRVLSLNRGKPSVSSTNTTSSSDAQEGRDGKQISPLSTSTVSTTSITSPSIDRERDRDRDRSRGSCNTGAAPTGRLSRLSLRGAGRMFSLTRRNTGEGLDQKLATSRGQGAGPRHSRGLGILSDSGKSRSKTPEDNSGGAGVAQKVDGRADKFVHSEITSMVIADSGLVGNSKYIRVPLIAMAEFSEPMNKEKWYIDVFTLPHNAVRRECIDLYDMLSALARCSSANDFCETDLQLLERWWVVANNLFRCYFEVERRVLFPWVDSAGAQEWEVQLALKKMRSLKDKLETQLGKVDRVWNEKTFKTVGETYALFYKTVDDFVPRLMNYFVDQEILLPAIVKEFYKKENRSEVDKQLVAAFLAPPTESHDENVRHNLVLLVRWITKSKQLRAWLGKNLSNSARSMYPTWYQSYEEQHLAIVKNLRSRGITSASVEQSGVSP